MHGAESSVINVACPTVAVLIKRLYNGRNSPYSAGRRGIESTMISQDYLSTIANCGTESWTDIRDVRNYGEISRAAETIPCRRNQEIRHQDFYDTDYARD